MFGALPVDVGGRRGGSENVGGPLQHISETNGVDRRVRDGSRLQYFVKWRLAKRVDACGEQNDGLTPSHFPHTLQYRDESIIQIRFRHAGRLRGTEQSIERFVVL